jgi:serine/threonine protein kinase
VLISDINQANGTHIISGSAIDNFNKNQYAQKVLAIIQNPSTGAIIKVVSEKPAAGFELLSCLIADRVDAIEKQIILDNLDSKKLALIINNVAKAIIDL